MPKAKNNQYTKVPIDTAVDKQNSTPYSQPTTTKKVEIVEDKPKPQTKAQAIADLGFTQKQAERFQTMANWRYCGGRP